VRRAEATCCRHAESADDLSRAHLGRSGPESPGVRRFQVIGDLDRGDHQLLPTRDLAYRSWRPARRSARRGRISRPVRFCSKMWRLQPALRAAGEHRREHVRAEPARRRARTAEPETRHSSRAPGPGGATSDRRGLAFSSASATSTRFRPRLFSVRRARAPAGPSPVDRGRINEPTASSRAAA